MNCYSHSPYKKNINLVKKEKIIENKTLSFLELAISLPGQFEVFSEYISFVLLEALKRNYCTSSNILQCRVLYTKRNRVDAPLDSLLLSRLAGSVADSDCWNTVNPNPCSPPSEQYYPF